MQSFRIVEAGRGGGYSAPGALAALQYIQTRLVVIQAYLRYLAVRDRCTSRVLPVLGHVCRGRPAAMAFVTGHARLPTKEVYLSTEYSLYSKEVF